MIRKFPVANMVILIMLLAGGIYSPDGYSSSSLAEFQPFLPIEEFNDFQTALPESLDELNNALFTYLSQDDLVNSKAVAEELLRKVRQTGNDYSEPLSTSNYLLGVYSLKQKKYKEAIGFLKVTAGFMESRKTMDESYAKALYNLSVAYNGMGDYVNQRRYSESSLEVEKKIYGELSPSSISTYFSLTSACIGLQDYEKALEYSKIALNISGNNPGLVDITSLTGFYSNIGVLYIRLADYSKAKVYLEKAELIYKQNNQEDEENYFSLLNNLAMTYGYLGLGEKSTEYYEKGINLALSKNSESAYNYINSYAIVLGLKGNIKKGESLLRRAMVNSGRQLGEDSPLFFSALFYYAEYLREFKVDKQKALNYFNMCLNYISKNEHNLFLKEPVYLGYASLLTENGEDYKALEVLQSLLFGGRARENIQTAPSEKFLNPQVDSIKAEKYSLKILRLKYLILWKIYTNTQDINILEAAESTATLIVGVLEKVRINISEEDSRLILGDHYRNSYLDVIRDLNLLYQQTGNRAYLEEAFEFSEKSKVAGLLTATREMNAAQFNIPSDLSEFEKRLKNDIGLYNAKIDEEVKKGHTDSAMINMWKEKLLKSSLIKDSLIAVFEKKYPGYYSFKYNTSVAKLGDLPGLIGRNGNYVNYILSDTVLYIFVANRKHLQLLSLPADSSLYSDIKEFRKLLGMPSPSGNAREAFVNYQKRGYNLYQKIIEPIRPYLISKKLLISPDNILSYIPFETIPTSPSAGDRILYNQIHYMMNEFDISYTYSVTFLAESMKRKTRWSNRLIAFAPSYSEPINIGTVLMNRQIVNGMLPDLPYAKQEAEYVSSVTNGTLYENEQAKETVFKSESGKYDVIHLAMHTILNDKDPMYSTLIFSSDNDSTQDRYLKTYEVYSIPLRAKMVVLSSCNSGTGFLYSGEGILSLARGFMYSGSESVVMAMWEIEDRSGTEIVKGFYDNLKKGYSKSSSLRRARIKYLKQADQLRSHPYFWSTLVVYGNNNPLYYSKFLIILPLLAGIVISLFLGIYFWRRKNS
jgi:CHAT domain-containing protein